LAFQFDKEKQRRSRCRKKPVCRNGVLGKDAGGGGMTESENLFLHGLKIAFDTLSVEVAKLRRMEETRNRFEALPEWIDLETAVALKRGAGGCLTTYRQKLFLQPCCGLNYKIVGGRRCWRKEDVIAWLAITDEDLKGYAEKHRVGLPATYQKRAATWSEI
jgi:hypothetical protein